MQARQYREDLPPRPARFLSLPLDERGFPVPWFVAKIEGKFDFRVIRPGGVAIAHNRELCWLCGERRGAHMSFVIGPMCGINRTTAEPPSHTECAEYAVKACPFLTRPMAVRNERDMPEEAADPAGDMLRRNPGVSLLWTTKSYKPFRAPLPSGGYGVLFQVGEPTKLSFWCKGRAATREELQASISSGYPQLRALAEAERGGLAALQRSCARFDALIDQVYADAA